MRLGLERIRALLAALGSPQEAFDSVLVAGTNGKGSTAALLASILRAAALREGLYTSPHLHEVEERIRLVGQEVAPGALATVLEEVLAAADKEGTPTVFEALTAAGLVCFARGGVELAVLEVGLGGRLDATNAVDPILSLVSSIGADHGEHLGPTLPEIAREKAGTFRRGRPALVRVDDAAAAAALEEAAARIGARLLRADELVQVRRLGTARGGGQRVAIETGRRRLETVLPLAGAHQIGNLALAVAAAELLEQAGRVDLSSEALRRGVAACRWPARLEELALPDGKRVLLDAAHNPSAIARTAAYVAERGGAVDLLFGVLGDKAVGDMLPHLLPLARRVVLTRPPGERGADPSAYAALAAGADVIVDPDPGTALDAALAGPSPTLLVCGSIYLVAAVRALLLDRFGLPA